MLTVNITEGAKCPCAGRPVCIWTSWLLRRFSTETQPRANEQTGNFWSPMSALDNAQVLELLQPKEYYKKWMEAYYPKRPDHRSIHAFRQVTLQMGTIGTADASATIRLGNTIVIGAIKAEVAEPPINNPESGYLVANVTLCSGCSPSVRTGPPTDRAQLLTEKVSFLLQRTNIVSEGALCIVPGKLVWVLHIDAHVINDAGNIFDAAWLSILAAFSRLQLPVVHMDESTGMVYSNPKDYKPFKIQSLPLPVSFLYLPERNSLLADPSDQEELALGKQSVELIIDIETNSILHCETYSVPKELLGTILASEGVQRHLHSVKALLL